MRSLSKKKRYLGTEEGDDPSIHIVISGDFAQLLLCFEIFIFSPPVKVKTNAGPSSEDETKLKSSGHRNISKKKRWSKQYYAVSNMAVVQNCS